MSQPLDSTLPMAAPLPPVPRALPPLLAAGWSALELLSGGRRLAVLMFHRVRPAPDPLFPGEIDAARFDRLLSLLAASYTVLTLGAAVERLRRNSLPPRALAITFDDGYADNAEVALPLLQRHGLRATFFISTGFLDGGRMWNDTIIETVRRCTQDEIDLSAFGLGLRPLGPAAQRRALIDELLPAIKYRGLDARQAALAELAERAGHPVLPGSLMLSTAQVRSLADAGMELGGHTVNHPILTETSPADVETEIAQGRERLRQISGQPVEVFAYPNGRPGQDYDASHVELVRKAGFVAAVSTAPGAAGTGADLLQLPRFTPWDSGWWAWSVRMALNQSRRQYLTA